MAALHCQEAGQTGDQSSEACKQRGCLPEETEMTCNKTQRRTHGVCRWGGGVHCPPLVDYNTKWQLTTEIYLANASPETFTEITIAKLACLAGQDSRGIEAGRVTRSSRTIPDCSGHCHCHLGALSFVCVNAKSFGLSMPDADNFGLIARSHRIASARLASPRLGFMQVQGTIDACTTLI